MTPSRNKTATLALALALALGGNSLAGEPPRPAAHWATSWHASPQPAWGPGFILPTGVPVRLARQSTRETLRLSAGCKLLRLVLSNRYGQAPVAIGRVLVSTPERRPGASRTVELRFGGRAGATLAPGARLVSDPVELETAALERLAVSTYFPGQVEVGSFHWGAQQTVELADGERGAGTDFPAQASFKGRLFLNAVLVETDEAPARTVVVLGDSITDGNGSTPDRDLRWPDALARRLAPRGIAVANAGISGARLLRDGMGTSALARLDQDVFALPGADTLVILLGTNDIGWPGSPFAPQEWPAAFEELAAGYAQVASAARAHGLRVVGATLPPFRGALEGTPFAGHYSQAKDALRNRVNDWIRTQADFDAVVDVDALLRDPADPRRLLPAYDSGDHLHPGDRGYAAMAGAFEAALAPR